MRKIVCFSLFCYLILGLTASAHAQQISVEATVSENKIFKGEQFSLSVEVKGSSMQQDVELPVLPKIDGVRVLSQTPSRSTSISIVNGRTTASTAYNYSLIGTETGTFTIPPIPIRVAGEERVTNPIQIEIIEKGNISQDGARQLPDIFVEIELDDENPVTGQQIVASLVLFFKQGIEVTSFRPAAGWRTDGFWKEELENISQPSAETVIFDGVRYRKATLLRYALFPTRSGDLTMSEFSVNLGVRSQSSRNDPFGSFFGGFGTNQRRVTIEADEVKLNVNPIPESESGSININAVGQFSVSRRLSANQVRAGETVELVTTVEGVGNIPLVKRPVYNIPDGFDLYSPQESSDVERRGEVIRGSKIFTELMVPRAPGSYQIPAERVFIYDANRNRNRYINLPDIEFEVLPASTGSDAVATGFSSRDIQPVTGLVVWSGEPSKPFYQTIWMWFFLLMPLITLIGAYYKKWYDQRLSSDKSFARSHFAEQRVEELITEAREHMDRGELKQTYHYLYKALYGFISDKLNLKEAGMSDVELLDEIKKANIHSDLIKKTGQLLNKCETISYAPVGAKEDVQKDIAATEDLIKQLGKKL